MRSHVISFRLSLVLLLSCFVLLTACGQSSSPATGAKQTPTPTVALDVYGTPIVFPTTAPQRIVSLVPSASEILGALHLQSRVVGVDHYTDYPPGLASLPKVSNADGKFNIEEIVALKPDLVLSWGGGDKTGGSAARNPGLACRRSSIHESLRGPPANSARWTPDVHGAHCRRVSEPASAANQSD